jgi:hypothetical protein
VSAMLELVSVAGETATVSERPPLTRPKHAAALNWEGGTPVSVGHKRRALWSRFGRAVADMPHFTPCAHRASVTAAVGTTHAR